MENNQNTKLQGGSSQNLKSEIIALENKFWSAMKDHKLQDALDLTYFPCVVAGSHGLQAVDRPSFEKMFESQKDAFQNFKIDESKAEVRQVAPDTVIVAYNVHASLNKDGKAVEIDAVDTSTWVKQGGKWLCAMHTETMLQH